MISIDELSNKRIKNMNIGLDGGMIIFLSILMNEFSHLINFSPFLVLLFLNLAGLYYILQNLTIDIKINYQRPSG